jgi:hypothetical protein
VVQLLNRRMADGSRLFGELPQRAVLEAMRDHLSRLPGADLTGFVREGVSGAWIDFSYEGHAFSVNDPFGEYWFYVADAGCPDPPLEAVLAHFRQLCG